LPGERFPFPGGDSSRLILTSVSPGIQPAVKASLREITFEYMKKLARTIDPNAEFSEPVEFETSE
jgi:hypothetical protein